MFFPLYDKNPLQVVAFQAVTIILMVICIVVYMWQSSATGQAATDITYQYGMIPAVIFNLGALPAELVVLPAEITLISYMFLHGSWWHLLGNMLFLWVFGDNIEDAMGHWRFILFYLVCGIIAALLHGIMEPGSKVPLVGASGAIAGLLGAYLLLHPRVKLLVLLFGRVPVQLPSYILIIGWFLFQFISVWLGGENIAWWAHIGGFCAGMLLIVPLRHKHIPLLDFGTEH